MNKNANIQKINKIGKLCRIFSKIAFICCIVGTVLTLMTGIVSKVSPEHLHLFTDEENLNLQELAVSLCVLISSGIFYFNSSVLSKKIESCETPFTSDIIYSMRRFGIAYIICSCIAGVSGVMFGFVASVLVILLLVNVFAYGAELQKESDETL